MKIKIVMFAAIIGLSLILLVSWGISNKKQPEYRTVSSNGESIAENLESLKSILSNSVYAKFNKQQDFTITGITYIQNKFSKGVIANIDFKTTSGDYSNVVLFQNIPSTKIILEGKVLDDSYMLNKAIKVTCTGRECCQVHVRIGDDNNIKVDCTCNPCSIYVD
ncbi:MAG: hypothetical protein LW718_02855 [Sediminibacterium sp.]|jgi:hypothetical protein|nr:hypothetical protein [Sediminibacterium sp.]